MFITKASGLQLFVTVDWSTFDNFTADIINLCSNSLCTQPCFHGKNQPITCPKSEWCHHQYTFCNFAAWY